MYVEVAKGVYNRNIVITPDKLKNFIKPNQELFRSYFLYENPDIENYSGKYHIKTLILDIDKKENEDLNQTLQRVRIVVNKLIKEYDLEDNLQIWFSGTGFHIHIPDIFGFEPSKDLPDIVRETISTHFPEVDIKPIQRRGLIRVQFSFNSKSGLYKTLIPESDIWFITPEKVIEMAKEFTYGKVRIPSLKEPVNIHKSQIIKPKRELRVSTFKPNRVVTCMQHCYNAGPVKGHRHERMLRMVSWMKRQGMPVGVAVAAMKEYLDNQLHEYGERQLSTDVHSIYSKDYAYGCNDKVMKQFCDPQCIFFEKKNYIPEVATAMDIAKDLSNFINSDWKKVSIDLGKLLGLNYEWWLMPEDLVGIIGATGLNKTAFVQNIVVRLKDEPILYISTEFSNRLLLRRFLQIDLDRTKTDILTLLSNADLDEITSGIKHISFVNFTPDFGEMEELIKRHRPKLLVVDTIDDIRHGKYKGLESEERVYSGLKDLARKYKLITIAVHHISKHAAYDEAGNPKKLNVSSGKGSSSFEQKSDILLGIEGLRERNIRTLRTLKTRDNVPFVIKLQFNMDTFKFKRMEDV